MRLILARHAQTNENKKKLLGGHTWSRLTLKGIKQAQLLAKRLRKEKIDAIYSSDLTRTVQTAKEIMKYHPHLKLHKLKEFRELDWASWSGKRKDKVDFKKVPSDVESRGKLRIRAISVFKKLYQKHKGQNIILVGHGGTNSALVSRIMKVPMNKLHIVKRPANTAVTIIETKNNNAKITLLNCTKHLENNKK